MTHFHADDYINFLRIITPDNMHHHLRQLQRCASWRVWVVCVFGARVPGASCLSHGWG